MPPQNTRQPRGWGKLMFHRRVLHLLLPGLLVALCTGCASNVPKALRSDVPETLSQRVVQAEPARYQGREVVWGGEILAVRNASLSTDVEIYGRPLAGDAEPRASGGDGVRFIARVDRFLDPAEYQPGKRMSVRGSLGDPVVRPVGEYIYRYPLVNATVFHLWPKYRPPDPWPYHDPYYPNGWPWWSPWGPYRYWPYGW